MTGEQGKNKMVCTVTGIIRDKDGNIKEEFTEVSEHIVTTETRRIE